MKTWSSIARARISDLPVVPPGALGEGGGDGDHAGAPQGEDPVELGEAEVVTDGQPDLRAVGLAERDLVTGLLDLGLAVGDVADVHVEHVDLAVDRRAARRRGRT